MEQAKLHYNPVCRTLVNSLRKQDCAASFSSHGNWLLGRQMARTSVPGPAGPGGFRRANFTAAPEDCDGRACDAGGSRREWAIDARRDVVFSNGDKITRMHGAGAVCRALNVGTISGLDRRAHRARCPARFCPLSELPANMLEVGSAPRAASLSDRFEITGHGFCGDADANHVTIGGIPALVLASSPAYLAVLPPLEWNLGQAGSELRAGRRCPRRLR